MRNLTDERYVSLIPSERPEFSHLKLIPTKHVQSITILRSPLDHLFEDLLAEGLSLREGLREITESTLKRFEEGAGFGLMELLSTVGPEVTLVTAEAYRIALLEINHLDAFTRLHEEAVDRFEDQGARKVLYGVHELYRLPLPKRLIDTSPWYALHQGALVLAPTPQDLKSYFHACEGRDFRALNTDASILRAQREAGGAGILHLYRPLQAQREVPRLSTALFHRLQDETFLTHFPLHLLRLLPAQEEFSSLSAGLKEGHVALTSDSFAGPLSDLLLVLRAFPAQAHAPGPAAASAVSPKPKPSVHIRPSQPNEGRAP
jgi:hypothetical protein